MNDLLIVQLFWERSEQALEQAKQKYGAYCLSIARNILFSGQDAEEAAQDTWLAAWNSIPPQRPAMLKTYLGKLTRRIALKKCRERMTQKRGGGELPLALSELEDCLAAPGSVEVHSDTQWLAASIDRFLQSLRREERNMFVCRYWYLDSIEAISNRFCCSQSKVKSMLYRLRKRLHNHLESEGFWDEE